VAFAVVTWRRPHLIVMDEPTNHLDLETVEALIKALQVYTGGIVVVSHDQYFLSEVANEFWGVSNAHVKRFDSFETAKKFSY
jgi:ATP-binding cassette subfamily F protein 3